MNNSNLNSAEFVTVHNEDESTVSLAVDPENGANALPPDELRKLFDISDGDDVSDYGDLKIIGMGGMGAVFQADDPALQRKVALKILRSDFRNRSSSIKRFVREARITARIDHPNIISVHRLGVLENIGVYFTMRRIHGENLREIFNKIAAGHKKTCHIYTLRRLLEIFIAGCNGVAAAHNHNILHCDLKPGNLMIGEFGEVMVLDWGVAKEMMPAGPYKDGQLPIPEDTVVVEGTPAFMAPELLGREISYPDEQTDVYALGVILYTILTRGNLPFDISKGADNTVNEVLCGNLIPLRSNMLPGTEYHSELEAICRKAMARDRLQRYASVEALCEDIYNYLDGYPVSASSPTIFDRFFKMVRRHPLIPSVLLAIGLSLAGYCGLGKLQQRTGDRTLLAIINDNYKQANTNRKLALRRSASLKNDKFSSQEYAAMHRNVIIAAANASVEYNSIFDAACRLTESAQNTFLRSGGSKFFVQVIRMHWHLGNKNMLREFINRCRRQWHELFQQACRMDKELSAIMARLQSFETGKDK